MSAATDQARIFAEGEADRWFERNREVLRPVTGETDLPLRLIELYGLRPRSVIEIGAANGYRLASLVTRHGCRTVGVELSPKAIGDGRLRFPAVEFHQGDARDLPVDEQFDLVIVNFVFHWIDRASLLRAAAETDRVVADRGYLIIGDFYPRNLLRVRYHHLPQRQVFTYKQDYAALFTASGLYRPIALLTGSSGSGAPIPDVREDERAGTWLLQKQLDALYVEREHVRQRGAERAQSATGTGA